MTVWIELAFLQNFIVDFSLLYLTCRTARLPPELQRLVSASVSGGLFALLFPLLSLPWWAASLIRLAFGGILCLISLPTDRKNLILGMALFYFYCFLYGGLLWGLYSAFPTDFLSGQTGSMAAFALALLPIFLFFCLFGVRRAAKRWLQRKTDYPCTLYLGEKKVRLKGLMDTGNSLSYRQSPVCLIAREVQERRGTSFPICSCMVVRTATGEGILPVFRAKIKIYSEKRENIIDNVYFAVSSHPLGGDYEVILHPQLLKEGCHAERVDT